jgi:hypothetical protein
MIKPLPLLLILFISGSLHLSAQPGKTSAAQMAWHEHECYLFLHFGPNLLLNVPPDRRGLIHERDSAALVQVAELRRQWFGTDLAKTASIKTGKKKQPVAL